MRTDKSFISARLLNESFLSYQVGWPSQHKYPHAPPPLFLPSTFCVVHPFTCSAGFPPYSPALTQIRSGARREVKERIHATYQTKAWHRYKRGDQHFKSIWCRWTVQQGQLQQGSTKLPQTCGNCWGAALLFLHLYASLINCVYKIGRSLSLGYSPCVAWQLLQGKQFFLLQ